ncbi:MAG: hypothetical protein ACI857_003290, partial [Arenicella sp.]
MILRLLSILFLFSINLHSLGQKDSLLNKLGVYEKLAEGNLPQSDTNLVIRLKKEVAHLIYLDPIKSMDYARKIYDLSILLKYNRGIATGMRLIGDNMMIGDEVDSAQVIIK